MPEQRPTWEINKGRFERRVIKTPGGCWTWDSTVDKRTNTPVMQIVDPGTRREKVVTVRRWIWEQQYGPLPKETADRYRSIVVNVCGNKLCVMPSSDHNTVMESRERFLEVRTVGNKGGGYHVPSEEEFMKGGK